MDANILDLGQLGKPPCHTVCKDVETKVNKKLEDAVRILVDFKHGLKDAMEISPEEDECITLTKELVLDLQKRIDKTLLTLGI